MTPVTDDASVVEARAHLCALLRREGRHGGEWYADRLLEAADTIEQLSAALTALREKDGWRPIGELTREDGAVLARRADGGAYGFVIGVKYDLIHRGEDWILDEWNGKSVRCTEFLRLPAAPVVGEG